MPQHHGPLDSGRGQALLAHELVHVGQQRRLGSSLPEEHTSAGQQLEREAQSAESLVERARHAPALDMPLARPQRAPAESTSDGHSNDVRQATQAALTHAAGHDALELPTPGSAASHEHAAPAQRAALSSAPSRTMTASSGGAGSAVAATGPTSDQELEELARKLYDRMRHRFKKELLLDRERGGFLTDSR